MISQQSITAGNVVAIWVGDFDSPGDLDSYLMKSFEADFGFRMNDRAMPEVSEPSGSIVPIKALLTGFSFSEDWIADAVLACREKKIEEAKAAVVFHHLRYPEGAQQNPQARLTFVANVPWNA